MAYQELKERIKDSPVSLVVGHYISLNKRGSNLEAICPFHADTKPSLKVNDSKGMYKCFACGAGGDAITFVINYKKIEFVEALKEIADILGLPFEEQKEKRKNPRLDMALRVLHASVRLYQKVAATNSASFKDFLIQRKLDHETAKKWQIGLSPGNNGLVQYLNTIPGADGNLARSIAREIGIIRLNEKRNELYDFFRDRIMFPILDHSGQIRGYSSRAILPGQIPKYLNSGESFAFDKKSILFGFYFAKSPIRQNDQAIIVEGNMDVIMMHQFGFAQTIGTMGTALSPKSAKLLGNMTKNIFLAMDSDEAGIKAMKRINAEFLSLGIIPRHVSFAPHKDPDEFLIHEGRLALLERLEKSPHFLDVLIDDTLPENIPENTDLKLELLQQIFTYVSPLKEELSATERVVSAAKRLRLRSDPATILENYKEFLSRQKDRTPPREDRARLEVIEEKLEQNVQQASILHEKKSGQDSPKLLKSERLFLREILCHPEFLTYLKLDDFLATIGHDEVKRLIQWLAKIYLEIDDAEYVSIVGDEIQYGGYGEEIISIGTEALFHHGNKYNEKVIKRMLKDFHLGLRLDQLKEKRQDLIAQQLSSPTQIEIDEILSEISKLDKEIMNLKTTVS